MTFLVIGCGSIGQRHIKNLKEILKQEVIAVDVNADTAKEVSQKLGIKTFGTLEQALAAKPDAVLVCTPNDQHIEQAVAASRVCSNIFIEKPISHTLEQVDALIGIKGLTTLIGCNMRFHPALKAIRKCLDENRLGRIVSVRAHFGHWLPNWRPQTDYRNTYSAKADQGGGIILDAIHEIDYLMWLFGDVKEVAARSSRSGCLEIETEDTAEILLGFENDILGSIHMDYIQRTKRRGCEIVSDQGTLIWESLGKAPEKVTVTFHSPKSAAGEIVIEADAVDVNAMYVEEMAHFIKCAQKEATPIADARHGKKVLDVALTAKEEGKKCLI